MASTSVAVATHASSSHAAMKKYDVFISFRGEDTRHNFTSHLHSALLRQKIETYIDYRLEKGDDVWPTLVQAIHDSSVSLIIFSENYASSTWCLNELNEIMGCKKNEGQDVIPVFYKIDPSHVRKQNGSYKTAFDKHEEQDIKHSNKWRETLFEAANISGFDSAVCRHDWLGAGSRVIVTARDRHILISGGVDEVYEFKEMSSQNSLQLFSSNAFENIHPRNGYEELSEKAVVYAKGIPLVLKVLGSLLYSKSENEWESALAKLKKFPNDEIQEVLRLSYYELDDTEKEIFFDIACFFKGHARDIVSRILNACGFFAHIGIRSLLDKALITIDVHDSIRMHDLIQKMCHDIIRSESINNYGQRRRLWDSEEVYDVLKNNRGTDAVESILLDMSKITDLHLSSHVFKEMANLRLLALDRGNHYYTRSLNSVTVSMDIEFPNKLRYIHWDGYPLKSLPSICCWEKLVYLSMRDSNVEKLWNGIQKLPNLKNINLEGSERLRECPNLSGAPNLEYLSLEDCIMLTHVDASIFSLQKLVELNVYGCKELKSLCSNICPSSLRKLYASGCQNLHEFSVIIPADQPNTRLGFYNSGMDKVPSSILHLRNLEFFTFPLCESLMDLPENFANWIGLQCNKYECDSSITLGTVLYSPAFLTVKHLSLYNLYSELPDNIWLLSSLESLTLSRSSVVSLPESIKYLPRLESLDVSCCIMLQSVPMLPQSIQNLNAKDCISLKTVVCPPSKKGDFRILLRNCFNLDQDAYNNIIEDAAMRIKHGERSLSEDNDFCLENGKIFYLLPVRCGEAEECYHYCYKQASVTIDLPPNSKILTFIFYFTFSHLQPHHIAQKVRFGCECNLVKSSGERIDVTSFFMEEVWLDGYWPNHEFIWYDAQCCKEIIEAIKERKAINGRSTTNNPNVTFKFFARNNDNEELPLIKECHVLLLDPSGDQSVEKERISKFKRSREIYESHEPDEIVLLTKKFKQCVFGTPSDQNTEEMEDLRLSIELHLHISEDLN